MSEVSASLAALPDAEGVVLTGPEPFFHPELPALIAACRDAGFSRIALETDAGALAAHGNAAGVLHAGVRHLWVRVLGADDATHDERIGRPGRAAAARVGVAAYRTAALEAACPVVVTAIVPVCRHTLPELPAIVAECGTHGFDAVRLVSAGPLPGSAASVIAAACDTGMVNRTWVATDSALPLPDSHRLHGDADGAALVASDDGGSL
ncbi:MAG: hypothetical protein ACYC62_06845 [Coriobacteriia bacterium]